MSSPKKMGQFKAFVPNRDADKRRRNNTFFKGIDFADKSIDRYERKYEKRLEKEALIGKA